MSNIFKFNNEPIWKLNEALDKIQKTIYEIKEATDQRVIDRCILRLEQIKETADKALEELSQKAIYNNK